MRAASTYHRPVLIPLGTDRGLRRPALVTPVIILITVVAYLAMSVLEAVNPDEHERLLTLFWVVGGDEFRWWQPVTSTLLHGGLWHLGGNMLFLWVFGQAVEDRLGRVGYIVLYVAGAFAAGGLHAAFERTWEPAYQVYLYHPAVGASGAIAAVTGAFLVYFPRTVIKCFFFFGLSVVGVPAWWFIGLAICWNLFSHGLGVDRGVAYLAHLGGYGLGFSVAFAMLAIGASPREPYDLFSMFKQAKRRRQFRAAASGMDPAARVRATPEKGESRAQVRVREEIAQRRAAIARMLAEGQHAEAMDAYRALVRDHEADVGLTTLSRQAQYDLAARFVQEGADADAAGAYERFLTAYPKDREAGVIGVLLARLWARLGRADDAVGALREAAAGTDEGVRELARAELESMGHSLEESNA